MKQKLHEHRVNKFNSKIIILLLSIANIINKPQNPAYKNIYTDITEENFNLLIILFNSLMCTLKLLLIK